MKETMKVIDRKIKQEQELNPASGMNAAKMAERMHIDPSLFSRWRVETGSGVNRETLTSMLFGFSTKPEEQAELLGAYLLDQKRGRPGSELVEIVVSEKPIQIAETPSGYGADKFAAIAAAARSADLDEKTRQALTKIIAGLESNPNLRRVVLSLAKMANQ
jgi:hypothetical protein